MPVQILALIPTEATVFHLVQAHAHSFLDIGVIHIISTQASFIELKNIYTLGKEFQRSSSPTPCSNGERVFLDKHMMFLRFFCVQFY